MELPLVVNVSLKRWSYAFVEQPFCSWMWRLYATSMSVEGSRMAIAHSLTHSLTLSILINLFIKLELSNFLLPPVLIVFVQECSVVLRKVWRGETRKAYICTFWWRAWKRVCRAPQRLNPAIMVFMWFCFVNMLFLTIGFCSNVDESW